MEQTGQEHIRPDDICRVINKLQTLILIHSYIYYWLDFNVITDSEYDKMARELKELARKYPEEAKQSVYYEDFKEFYEDNCPSGFNLPYRKEEVIRQANKLLRR